ncbi:anti-sigma factor antagonist [Streptomyces beigongshangae]|uniref:anti-sigma factor antagonist n=1 Tax=Streptomyces beigongshangae TaxID=2841597 RepID=UPI0021A84C12|nr:anti-sigma factor antagonist [Streptomyces sp. REN17]
MRIEARPAGGRTTVVAVGEIDLATSPGLRRSLHEALSVSARGIDLDLSGVGFCDCSGLNVLMLVQRHAAADGRTVVLRSASPAVERLLTLTGTSSLFSPAQDTGPGAARHPHDPHRPHDLHDPRPGAAHSTTEESPLSDDVADDERDLRAEVAQSKRAMRTRPVIDLARGVLMATFGLSPEDAWSVLVTVSQNSNVELHHLAGSTVAAVRGEPLPEPLRQRLSAAAAELSASPPAPGGATVGPVGPGAVNPGPVRRSAAPAGHGRGKKRSVQRKGGLSL